MMAIPLVGSLLANTADSTRFICVCGASAGFVSVGAWGRPNRCAFTMAWTSGPLRETTLGGGGGTTMGAVVFSPWSNSSHVNCTSCHAIATTSSSDKACGTVREMRSSHC
jgi:hypothetical protein